MWLWQCVVIKVHKNSCEASHGSPAFLRRNFIVHLLQLCNVYLLCLSTIQWVFLISLLNVSTEHCKKQCYPIPPRPVYHPRVINALFSKPPSQLIADEEQNFKQYQQDKTKFGEPLETEVMCELWRIDVKARKFTGIFSPSCLRVFYACFSTT